MDQPEEIIYVVELTAEAKLREGPSENAAALEELAPGLLVEVLEIQKDWYRVRTPQGQVGWVLESDLPLVVEALAAFLEPAPESAIDREELQVIYEAIEGQAGLAEDERTERRKTLDWVVKERTRELDLLVPAAHDYLRGDPNAEQHFLSTLNFLVVRESPPPRPASFTMQFEGQGGQAEGNPGSAESAPGFLPPEPPPFDRGSCLFPPLRIAWLNLAAVTAALGEGEPDDPRVQDIIWAYMWTIHRLVEEAEGLELLYAAAREVAEGDSRSLGRFSRILELVAQERIAGTGAGREGSPREAGEHGNPNGNLRPISGSAPGWIGLPPPMALDLCRLGRVEQFDRIRQCLCRERYRIDRDGIVNVTRGRGGPPIVGAGCPGDWIEIHGSGFGDRRPWGPDGLKPHVVFPRRSGRTGVAVTDDEDYPVWRDDLIKVKVPDGAASGRLSLVILCPGTRLPCLPLELPEGNRRFQLVGPPRIREFRIEEACDDTITLRIRAANAERISVTNTGGWGVRRSLEDTERYVLTRREPGTVTERPGTVTVRAENLCGSTERLLRIGTNEGGVWGPAVGVGISPVHVALLLAGSQPRVLFFHKNPTGGNDTKWRSWDVQGSELDPPRPDLEGYNLYCSGHCLLADGRLFLAGGQRGLGAMRRIYTFDPSFDPSSDDPDPWTRVGEMEGPRWYPTCVTLPDGRVLVMSGSSGNPVSDPDPRDPTRDRDPWHPGDPDEPSKVNHTMRIYDPGDPTSDAPAGWVGEAQPLPWGSPSGRPDPYSWKPHIPDSSDRYWRDGWTYPELYPRLHVLPLGIRGKVFMSGGSVETRLYDIDDEEWERELPEPHDEDFKTRLLQPRGWGGISVLLPLRPGDYRPKVLIAGGVWPPEDAANGFATDEAEVIDFGDPWPRWRKTESMSFARQNPNAVILPDGNILVVGGGFPRDGSGFSVQQAELFDPIAETWSTLCAMEVPRFYHTTALLLPDGRVLVAGTDGVHTPDGFGRDTTIEIYEPPYLSRGTGPEITSAPPQIRYGETIRVSYTGGDPIESVALLRAGSATHSFDADQRYVGLSFTTDGPGGLTVAAPPNGQVAPPGYYMLFIVTEAGVPSAGMTVRVTA